MKCNMRSFKESARFIILPSILSLMDVVATLLGQPAAYWQGDLELATDANRLVREALQLSPWLSLPAWLAWVGMITVVMLWSPSKWRNLAYTFFCLMHLCLVWAWITKWSLMAGVAFSLIAIFVVRLMRFQLRDSA